MGEAFRLVIKRPTLTWSV